MRSFLELCQSEHRSCAGMGLFEPLGLVHWGGRTHPWGCGNKSLLKTCVLYRNICAFCVSTHFVHLCPDLCVLKSQALQVTRRMLPRELCLAAALLFLTQRGAEGAPGTLVVRKLLQHPASSWSSSQRTQGKEMPSHLSWVTFDGELPADTVSNWNAYAKRMEYVCSELSRPCSTGSYVPSRGPFCFYPYGGREYKAFEFRLLVNRGNFEALRWVNDSFGGVPENAVEGCELIDIYVGRNQYGLGKVSKEQRAFFVVVDGKEVWYKWYQVLTVKTGPADIAISDVLYNVSEVVGHSEDVTITKTTVKNEGCQGTQKIVTLEEVTEVEHDWELDQKAFSSVHGVLEAGLLAFNGTGWEATSVTNVTWLGRASAGQYIAHTQRVELELQPRSACSVAMVGQQLDAHIPFTAWLSRDFGDGHPHRVLVTGVARSQVVVGIRAGTERCWPLPGSAPC